MTSQDNTPARHYEIALLVGPCLESEAEDFLMAVVEFANSWRSWAGNALGPVGSIGPWDAPSEGGAA